MDEATRDRFRKVKALMSSPNAGEAEAARNRYAAMVEKYGDPDAQCDGDFDPIGTFQRFYTSGDVSDLVDAMNGHMRASRRARDTADAMSYAFKAATRQRTPDPEHNDINATLQHAIWLGRECGRAVEWLVDEGFYVTGIAGGPWAVWECVGDRLDGVPPVFVADKQQVIIDFAQTKGMR